eukprot:TRINITY_DN3350_c0_g2_i3.p1 TRINITY_DN3350_c0_g2~~TRINITY_DN3350_c0_g2_i3.p1  ORF type:complete len:590 (+),score=110.26 TRINITY_DN3350_c0_g2_i3:163-1932(+)
MASQPPQHSLSHMEREKLDKLYKFFQSALQEHEQGVSRKFNQILSEITDRNRSPEILAMWMNIFQRHLSDTLKTSMRAAPIPSTNNLRSSSPHMNVNMPPNPSSSSSPKPVSESVNTQLINFVLHRMPWFEAGSNHVKLFDHLGKFVLTLLSFNPNYIFTVYKVLIQNLVPRELFSENDKGAQMARIKILDKDFESRADLIRHVKNILNSEKYASNLIELTNSNVVVNKQHNESNELMATALGAGGSDAHQLQQQVLVPLDMEDSLFMQELFKYHPRATKKLHDLKRISIGIYLVNNEKKTKCFFLEKSNSSRPPEDISYVKTCQACADYFNDLALGQKFLSAEQEELIRAVRNLITKIADTYPLTIKYIANTLNDVFPHKRHDERTQKLFLCQILRISLKVPKLQNSILSMIFERLLCIDAEISSHHLAQSHIDFENESYHHDFHSEFSVIVQNDEMARKLDSLLIILFDFIDFHLPSKTLNENPFMSNGSPANNILREHNREQKANDIFVYMLELFERHVLLAHQSKFIQFVLFYMCSFYQEYPSFTQKFLSLLIRNVRNENLSKTCLLYTSPSPRDGLLSRMPSSA